MIYVALASDRLVEHLRKNMMLLSPNMLQQLSLPSSGFAKQVKLRISSFAPI